MTKLICFGFLCYFLCFDAVLAQQKSITRGTIKIKKPGPTKYIISAKTSLVNSPQVRIFSVRGYNYNFKEYFPKDYRSELFPLVFNLSGLILTDENRQLSGCEIIGFEYEIFKSNVLYLTG
ncbi:MAG: hypothetical protein H0X46_03410, partial [Bacteroidetes bacterium]|nr:hypothetical protein [Bacteroidota bacterium]